MWRWWAGRSNAGDSSSVPRIRGDEEVRPILPSNQLLPKMPGHAGCDSWKPLSGNSTVIQRCHDASQTGIPGRPALRQVLARRSPFLTRRLLFRTRNPLQRVPVPAADAQTSVCRKKTCARSIECGDNSGGDRVTRPSSLWRTFFMAAVLDCSSGRQVLSGRNIQSQPNTGAQL